MSRRPILAREVPHLERLGRLLSTTRRALGLTQKEVALAAAMHWTHLQRIEAGTRRTRRSTLRRIAAVFVLEELRLGPVDDLLEDLVAAAGPALAEESVYAERVARRRRVREERAWNEHRQRRLGLLIESIERWERSEYAQMLSSEERGERWAEAGQWHREWIAEQRERRQALEGLREH
ncbi:MAG: helix-turn-helix domain-containing protein [Actinobacteria bacterium]|nr:helix-turn-helix domain-containing protein [Actinomycetota bacterium]